MMAVFFDTSTSADETMNAIEEIRSVAGEQCFVSGMSAMITDMKNMFEEQEMIVVCKPEESKDWYEKLWKNTVDLFRSMDIPVRTLECCSGDLADLKVKIC